MERSSKADYTAAAHVLCRIAVLNASSAQKEETLEACLGQIVDTNHLNVSYPELVTEDLCLVPEDFPCKAAWLDRNYAGESWYGVVRLRICSPCTTTTTTIALPSISVGRLHSIILDGQTAWHLGSNVDGEKGDGTTSTSDGHVPFNVMGDVRSVSCGARATLFLKVDGTAWGVGNNHYGQLGTGTTDDATTPVEIMGSVRKATMGIYNSVFVKEDGSAWTAGFNDQGQIGDGSKMYRVPTPVQVMTDVVATASGFEHTVFIKSDGTAWSVGQNNKGQLCDGTMGSENSKTTPVQALISDVHGVAAGIWFTVFLKEDGTAWACGQNDLGQLGDGSAVDRATPVQIMADVRSIAAGMEYTVFLKMDGTVWATGSNDCGQVGDGTTTQRTVHFQGSFVVFHACCVCNRTPLVMLAHDRITPVQIMSGVERIDAGGKSTLFVKSNGEIWAVGRTRPRLRASHSKSGRNRVQVSCQCLQPKLFFVWRNENGQLGLPDKSCFPTPFQAPRKHRPWLYSLVGKFTNRRRVWFGRGTQAETKCRFHGILAHLAPKSGSNTVSFGALRFVPFLFGTHTVRSDGC